MRAVKAACLLLNAPSLQVPCNTQAAGLFMGMSRVFVSEATGAAVYVFADDHCPPHVHARHPGEGWIARARFSYVDNGVALISIAPLKNQPLQRVVNALLRDIQTNLALCRRGWWMTRRTTCLENQWAVTTAGGEIALRPERSATARQIAGAAYDPASERLMVTFQDGTTAELGANR